MKPLLTSMLAFSQLGLAFASAGEQSKKNILFIAVDDLKPILGCYGNKLIKTPNIDRLASRGTVFLSNYCQQAVSGPTRASLMTGMRPDYTRVWDLKTKMRDMNPDIITLPQYLKENGYTTAGIGKIYDPRCVDTDLDKPSWSIPFHKNADQYYSVSIGMPQFGYQLPETKTRMKLYMEYLLEKGVDPKDLRDSVMLQIKPSVECVEVPDNAYSDGANALFASKLLEDLNKKKEPFFLAVGFTKPHLPFISPKKYWDLYNREEMPLAAYTQVAENSPEIAYHTAAELRAYSDIPPLISFTDQRPGIEMDIRKQKELIHGYYAAISYMDAQVGVLLNALDSLNLTENTIVVLWGDHGWHLGDHNLWCKHTNFEQATHAPLLISYPGFTANVSKSPTEFIDIFPTLCELNGLAVPSHLQGKSLKPVMKDPSKRVKEFAVSQYPRSAIQQETNRLGYSEGKYMGYSLRTERYRYTVWMKNNYRSTQQFNPELIIAAELYDYLENPDETRNLIEDKKYSQEVQKLNSWFKEFVRTQQITQSSVKVDQD